MPQTIQCVNCGVVLNLPDHAVGRKLKCPKCGVKFEAQVGPRPSTNGGGAKKEKAVGGPDSTFELSRKGSVGDLPTMPSAPGDLRETFGLPLMTDDDGPSTPVKKGAGTSAQPTTADAKLLFDDAPAKPRRKTGAEARSSARRCPTCGGVVPVGMSLCKTCGLDLESGTRVDLLDDLAPPPVVRNDALPMSIAIVGGICAVVSVALAVAALVGWSGGKEGLQYFIPVALFGLYAAVQFLRRKSVKLLLIALTFGAVLDLAGLIALPIYHANAEITIEQSSGELTDPDLEAEYIRPISERIDQQRITLGIALLFGYAVFSIFLMSNQVQKHFRK